MSRSPKTDAMVGRKYNRLLVLRKDGKHVTAKGKATNHWLVLCVCDCGRIVSSRASHIRDDQVTSCGCYIREITSKRMKETPIATTHGLWHHPLRVQWVGMVRRCNSPKAHNYSHYGGKGITVCDEWSTLDGYVSSVPSRPTPKHTLHRIDASKGYCPENCEWIEHSEHMKLHWKKGKRV